MIILCLHFYEELLGRILWLWDAEIGARFQQAQEAAYLAAYQALTIANDIAIGASYSEILPAIMQTTCSS